MPPPLPALLGLRRAPWPPTRTVIFNWPRATAPQEPHGPTRTHTDAPLPPSAAPLSVSGRVRPSSLGIVRNVNRVHPVHLSPYRAGFLFFTASCRLLAASDRLHALLDELGAEVAYARREGVRSATICGVDS